MNKNISVGLVAIGFLLALSGCVNDSLSTNGSCSKNSTPEDGYSFDLTQGNLALELNKTQDVSVSQTWLTVDTSKESKPAIREKADCVPFWTYSKENIVQVQGFRLTAQNPGITNVTGTVKGSSKTRDFNGSFWVLVNPTITESTVPNNTATLATGLSDEIIGRIDQSDVDWYIIDLQPGKKFRIELKNAVDLTGTSGGFSSNYSADFYKDTAGTTDNTSIGNVLEGAYSSTAPKRLIRVSGSSTSATPYSISVKFF